MIYFEIVLTLSQCYACQFLFGFLVGFVDVIYKIMSIHIKWKFSFRFTRIFRTVDSEIKHTVPNSHVENQIVSLIFLFFL